MDDWARFLVVVIFVGGLIALTQLIYYGFIAKKQEPVIDYFEVGKADSKAKQWRAAIGAFSHALGAAIEAKNYKRIAEIHCKRGFCYLQLKAHESAIEDFSAALVLLPKNIWCLKKRALGYQNIGNHMAAAADYNMAIELDPTNETHYYYRGITYLYLKQYSSAIQDFTEAIRLHQAHEPTDADWLANCLCCRCHAHLDMGNDSSALGDLELALSVQPNSHHACNNLAWVLATSWDDQLHNGARAVDHALRANKLFPDRLPYMGTLAAAYAEAGHFPEAIEWAQKFLDSNPPEENILAARHRLSLYEQGLPYRAERGHFETVRDN